jgi:hypothetical protein
VYSRLDARKKGLTGGLVKGWAQEKSQRALSTLNRNGLHCDFAALVAWRHQSITYRFATHRLRQQQIMSDTKRWE